MCVSKIFSFVIVVNFISDWGFLRRKEVVARYEVWLRHWLRTDTDRTEETLRMLAKERNWKAATAALCDQYQCQWPLMPMFDQGTPVSPADDYTCVITPHLCHQNLCPTHINQWCWSREMITWGVAGWSFRPHTENQPASAFSTSTPQAEAASGWNGIHESWQLMSEALHCKKGQVFFITNSPHGAGQLYIQYMSLFNFDIFAARDCPNLTFLF